MKEGGHEVSGVNASSYEVLCCSKCDDNITLSDADVLEIDETPPIIAPDIEITAQSSETEISLQMICAQRFPVALKLRSDANVWIGNTGASVDMMLVTEGLTSTRPCLISVHVGNSHHTAATHCGPLSVTVYDNTGMEVYGAAFPGMHLVPQAPYNIIILTQEWRTSGDWPVIRKRESF
jgi:hypothetical protein